MTITLNSAALDKAESLISARRTVRDERDDWSEDAPSTDDENVFIEKHGYAEYAKWHLGVDESQGEETKGRYSFPFGDFTRLHRCAVISLESRAAQHDHGSIARAAKKLLDRLDGE